MMRYQATYLMGIILIALGVVFSITLREQASSLGVVLIAIGGLFLIIGMSTKKRANLRDGEKSQ